MGGSTSPSAEPFSRCDCRVCLTKGQLPRVNQAQEPAQRQVLFDKINPCMALVLRCQELMARCSEAVIENGLRSMSLDQERSLDIILRTYESQVDDLELRAVTGILNFSLIFEPFILTFSSRY